MATMPSWKATSQENAIEKIVESLERRRAYLLENAPTDIVRNANESMVKEWIRLLQERDKFTRMLAGYSAGEILEEYVKELLYVLQKIITFQFIQLPKSFKDAIANVYAETYKYMDDDDNEPDISPANGSIPDVLMGTSMPCQSKQKSQKNSPMKPHHKFMQSSPKQSTNDFCMSCIQNPGPHQLFDTISLSDISYEEPAMPILLVGRAKTPITPNVKNSEKKSSCGTQTSPEVNNKKDTPKKPSSSCGTQTSPEVNNKKDTPMLEIQTPKMKNLQQECLFENVPSDSFPNDCRFTLSKHFLTPEQKNNEQINIKEDKELKSDKDNGSSDTSFYTATNSSQDDKVSKPRAQHVQSKKQEVSIKVPVKSTKKRSPEKSAFKTPITKRPLARNTVSKIPKTTSRSKKASPTISTPLRAPLSSRKSRPPTSTRKSFDERISLATPSKTLVANLPLRRSTDNAEKHQQQKLKSWKTLGNSVINTPTIMSPTRKLSEIAGFKSSSHQPSPDASRVERRGRQRPVMMSQIFN